MASQDRLRSVKTLLSLKMADPVDPDYTNVCVDLAVSTAILNDPICIAPEVAEANAVWICFRATVCVKHEALCEKAHE